VGVNSDFERQAHWRGVELMASDEHPKANLYKYVSPETGRIVLKNRTLRWSTPPVLNDPFDMQFAFQLRVDRTSVKDAALWKLYDAYYGPKPTGSRNKLGQVIETFRGKFPRLTRYQFYREFDGAIDESMDNLFARIPSFTAEIRDHFENDKILCLSEVPDSIVMWAFYAQNHSGMVLRFSDATGVASPWQTARPVHYVDEVPSIFDDESLSEMLSGAEVLTPRRVMDIFCYIKSKHWEHEREWRIYSGSGRTRGPHEDIPFNAKELTGVIFGLRMPESERKLIADTVRKQYPAAKLLKATTHDGTYGLMIDPL
jgi:hypothetical protein